MSECWKCQKPLPDGQVECEYGCRPVENLHNVDLRKPLSPEDVANALCAKVVLLTLQVQPDHAKITDPHAVEEFGKALERWLKLIARGYEESGLGHWCKKPEGL
jgi:hypothetical protein